LFGEFTRSGLLKEIRIDIRHFIDHRARLKFSRTHADSPACPTVTNAEVVQENMQRKGLE